MMQLLCNGKYLDLKRGEKFTFQKVNPLFAFDDLKCERTTEITLPDTPHNNRILQIAKNPAFYGEGMRRRFDAQLINGVCVKNGYLYVSQYEKGAYKAVFVTGELLALQKIRDIGNICDIITLTNTCQYGGTVRDASSMILPSYPIPSVEEIALTWANVRYRIDKGNLFPSMRVSSIISSVVSQNNLAAIHLPNGAEHIRLIPAKLNGFKSSSVRLLSDVTGQYDSEQHYNTLSGSNMELFGYFDGEAYGNVLQESRYVTVRHFVPKQEIKVTFPEDFPQDVHIVNFDEYGNHEFLGEWEFSKSWNAQTQKEVTTHPSGQTPLAGRTVTIPSGTPFVFVNEDDYVYRRENGFPSGFYYDTGWWFLNGGLGLGFDYTLNISGGDIALNDTVRLQDHLPEITLTDLLKVIAALTGTVLYYTDADGITFDTLDYGSWPTVELDGKIISTGTVKRTFSDYAQVNTISFDHDDWVVNSLVRKYTIDNDNIEAEKELTVIPFNEGNGSTEVYVTQDDSAEKMTFGTASTSSAYLLRVTLPENQGIVGLCNASTSVEVKATMPQIEFEQITPKHKVLVGGTLYVWTEAKWCEGVAEFSLSKI